MAAFSTSAHFYTYSSVSKVIVFPVYARQLGRRKEEGDKRRNLRQRSVTGKHIYIHTLQTAISLSQTSFESSFYSRNVIYLLESVLCRSDFSTHQNRFSLDKETVQVIYIVLIVHRYVSHSLWWWVPAVSLLVSVCLSVSVSL